MFFEFNINLVIYFNFSKIMAQKFSNLKRISVHLCGFKIYQMIKLTMVKFFFSLLIEED